MAQGYDPYGYGQLALTELLVIHKANWLRDIESSEYRASAAAISRWPGQDPQRYEHRWERKLEGLSPRLEDEEGDDLGVINPAHGSPRKFSQNLDGHGSVGMY